MHPTVMTMIAENRALDLRCAAEHRRGRLARSGVSPFFALTLPRGRRGSRR